MYSKPQSPDNRITPVRRLAMILLIFALLVGIVGYLADIGVLTFSRPIYVLVNAFYANVSAELASILLTILVIDALGERRAIQQEKRRLILQMGSPDGSFAREAVRQLRAEGWLSDGSLRHASLQAANLQKAVLDEADLMGADMSGANLSEASLHDARLQDTRLYEVTLHSAELVNADMTRVFAADTDMQEAKLVGVDLSGAILLHANLQNATLLNTVLSGADLSYANLRGAWSLTIGQLQAARSLAGTILPEGTHLPADDTWQATLSNWQKQVFINRRGFIVPATTQDDQTITKSPY